MITEKEKKELDELRKLIYDISDEIGTLNIDTFRAKRMLDELTL